MKYQCHFNIMILEIIKDSLLIIRQCCILEMHDSKHYIFELNYDNRMRVSMALKSNSV